MRKTKIVCTLGPATDREGVLRNMMLAGMDVARFNFSHGSHEEHLGRLTQLKALREELALPIAALMDTKGPEIRLGLFKDGSAKLKAGQTFTLTPREVDGTDSVSSITFKTLFQDLAPGSRVLLDDGKIGMVVKEIKGEDILCEVLNDGVISDRKSINVPGAVLSMPYLSQIDRSDILFAVEQGFDFIAASFVSNAADIIEIRRLLEENGGADIKIIAKIENQHGVSNIDGILAVSDGIMVARGDMGVEIDFTEIPIIQKKLIAKCYSSVRPAITATQMLESMVSNPRPTRAEITDVANAIYDGTSAIMLSGETASGKYPAEAVRTMAAIAERTESDIDYQRQFKSRQSDDTRLSVTAAVAHATCTTAMDTGAAAIITVTASGETARLLCKYRPSTPIIACVMTDKVCRQLALSWGISPIKMPYASNTDEMIELAVAAAKDAGLVRDGDMAVITAGVPVGVSGTTNMLKAHLIGDALVTGVGVGTSNAIGPVCLVRSLADLKRFKRGDVLVAAFTTNDMVKQIRDASAVVAEEGGLSSHAAVVGLTLGKPVIVGAMGALSKLQNGMRVSVDPEHGLVRTMPD